MRKILIFIPFFLFGEILSPLQNQLLNKDFNKAVVSGNKLKDSWVNPIIFQYKYNQTNQTSSLQKTSSFLITINQPIFKSGAIWASLKYANFLKAENIQKVELQKAILIKNAYEILFNIKKIEIAIKKQKYLLKNSNIDIKRKKEQFLSGVTDSSFLDNAILNKNNLLLALNDLIFQKQNLINNFKNFSDLNYKNIKLPQFELISKKEYLKNLNVKIAEKEIQVKKYLKKMNIGNSLISVNFIANYNNISTKYNKENVFYQDNNMNFYNLGFSISIPFDINVFKTIEESKIDYLKSILNYKNEIIESENEYNSKLQEIKNINNKIEIYKNSIKMYNSLIKTTKDNIKAGINTILDLENLENSLEISKLNQKSLEVEKNIKILNLFYLKGFK